MFLVACGGSERPAARDGAQEAGGGAAGMAAAGNGGGAGVGAAGVTGTAGMGEAGGSAGGMDGGAAGMAGIGAGMPDGATSDADASDGSADASGETSTDASTDASGDEPMSDGSADASGDGPASDAPVGCTGSSDCNDHNPCTNDTCDVGTGACHNTANTIACDDGNPCTIVDQCSAGQCLGSGAPDCDDHNVCTDDACNTTSGLCDHAANTRACDDDNQCTMVDQCSGGSCQGSGALNCDDSISCTTDSCIPAMGCKHDDNGSCAAQDAGADAGADADVDAGQEVGAPGCTSSADCDDTNQCTSDTCNAGACEHADISATCNDNNACTVDTCAPQTGCAHATADDGTSCENTFTCTAFDTCMQGVCVGGLPTQFAALSATGSGGGDPSLAIDDNAATSFSPTAANPRWIYVDLGSAKQIGRVQLDWGTTTYDGHYTIQVAGDAGNDATTLATDAVWTSIYTQSLWDNATGHSDNITGLNATGRYVRVYYWLPKTNFALATTALNLQELKIFGGADPACTAPPGLCAESTVPAGPITYENDATGNACAIVNGGAACGTTTGAGIGGTATIISARGVLSFANVDGGTSGGAATVTFTAAGATSARKAAAVYVKYEDGTEQGYGPITTTSTTFAATQPVQVWLKSGTHNTIEVRDSAGAVDVNGLPIVDSLTVTKLAGPTKTCEGTPFVIDSFEGAPTNDWNLSNATGVTSGDRRGITKVGTPTSAFQGNATTATNPPTGDLCLRMDATNYSWTTKLSNMGGLDNAYVQLILGANTGTPSITLALTADGVSFNTPVVLTASNGTNTNNAYGVIRNNMTGADTANSKVLVPVAAFGVPAAALKQVTGLRATISGNIWRIKDIQIVR